MKTRFLTIKFKFEDSYWLFSFKEKLPGERYLYVHSFYLYLSVTNYVNANQLKAKLDGTNKTQWLNKNTFLIHNSFLDFF